MPPKRFLARTFFFIATSIGFLGLIIFFIPTNKIFAAWTQGKGRIHSQGIPVSGNEDISDAIKILVPAGKMFNASRGITSARAQITVSPGNLAAPPIQVLKKYAVDSSNISYASLISRLQNPPVPVNGTFMSGAAPPDGLYITTGNLDITGGWNVGDSGQPRYIVVFVNGELTISNNITAVPGSFLAFIVKNDINIRKTVTSVQGIYYSDARICTKCQAGGLIDN